MISERWTADDSVRIALCCAFCNRPVASGSRHFCIRKFLMEVRQWLAKPTE